MGKIYKLVYSNRQFIYKIKNFFKKFKKQKDILLFCSSDTMEVHLREYYETVKEEFKNVRVHLFYHDVEKCYEKEAIQKGIKNIIKDDNIHVIKSYIQVWLKTWNLVVCADIMIPKFVSFEEVPIMYINHGLHMVSLDEGKSLFVYSKGHGVKDDGSKRFTVMLEPNKRYTKILKEENKNLQDVVRFVGYKYADKIKKEQCNYKKYRDELGFAEDEIVISVFGTWRENSLFHQVGKELIMQAEELQSKKYRFILSIHPREYTNYDENIKPLGEYVESQKEKGFTIRNPKQNYIPYMIASDVVISDYSSMYEIALIAGKPLILSKFPDEVVWEHSMARELKKQIPVFEKNTNLEDVIKQALEQYKCKHIYEKYAREIINGENMYRENVTKITKELLER